MEGIGSLLIATNHKIYLVLSSPNTPWQQKVQDGRNENINLPWATALEVACTWASGASSANEVRE